MLWKGRFGVTIENVSVSVLPGRELVMKIDTDEEGDINFYEIKFEGVAQYRCVFHEMISVEMIAHYLSLDLLSKHDGLSTFGIYFDDGPYYEITSRNASVLGTGMCITE